MARGKKNKPEIDICRVRTDRLREMNAPQLDAAARRVGVLYEIPKKQSNGRNPRWLLSSFITSLRNSKIKERPLYEDPAHFSKMRGVYSKMADHEERLIWQMQQKRGCKIPGSEIVARDAILEAEINRRKPDQDLIDKIRGKRRPKIR